MEVIVRTPARLHLGLLDTHGGLGRLYGSIGVAVEEPNVILEAGPADSLIVEGVETERVNLFAHRFLEKYPVLSGARIILKSSIPPHVGLGSGTQLALAVGTALARLGEVQPPIPEIAAAMGRGIHSGIGIAAFQQGGFILDGGHPIKKNAQSLQAVNARAIEKLPIPPVLFRYPFPEGWYFIVVVPEGREGFSGEREHQAFQKLPDIAPALAEKICRLVLMKMLPSLVERDIVFFGQAITEVQRLVGDCFAVVQGGRYAYPLSEELIQFMLEKGAAGAGQSSWGPTVYALLEGEGHASQLLQDLQEWLADRRGAQVYCVRADNRGARFRQGEQR